MNIYFTEIDEDMRGEVTKKVKEPLTWRWDGGNPPKNFDLMDWCGGLYGFKMRNLNFDFTIIFSKSLVWLRNS